MGTDRDETEADGVGVSTTRKTFALLEALKDEEGSRSQRSPSGRPSPRVPSIATSRR